MRRSPRLPLVVAALLLLATVPATAGGGPLDEPPSTGLVNAEVCPTEPETPEPEMPPGQRRRLIALGRQLFTSSTAFAQQPSEGLQDNDEILTCASCHNGPGFTDGRDHLVGPTEHRERVVRHTPHLLRIADTAPYGWDGRFPCLQAVIKGAIESPLEMNAGRAPTQEQLDALTAFVETLDAPDAVPGIDFDPAMASVGKAVFNDPRGTDPSGEFTERVSCATCHLPDANFTDRDFHKIVVPLFASPVDPIDPGHVDAQGQIDGFKTPVLRGLRFTAPYFHEGLSGDPTGSRSAMVNDPPRGALLAAIEAYNARFAFAFTPLEKAALVEFLLSL